MKLLKDRILKDGVVKPGNILKVDSFLNHQMDITLINEIGKEFKRSPVCNPPLPAAAMPASSLTTNLAGNFSLQSTKRT